MNIIKFFGENWRINIGLAIVLSGLPVVWVIRPYLGWVGSQGVSIVVMLIAIALIISWDLLFAFKIKIYSSYQLALLPTIFVVPVAMIGFLANVHGDDGPYYLLYSIVLLYAILSQKVSVYQTLPKVVAGISLLSAILTLLQVYFGDIGLTEKGIGEESARLYSGDSNNPNYIAFVAGYGLIGLFLSGYRVMMFSYFLRVIGPASILIVVILMSMTRSAIFGILFVGLVGLFFNHKNQFSYYLLTPSRILRMGFAFSAILAISYLLYQAFIENNSFGDFSSLFGTIEEGLKEGIKGFFFGQDVTDQSTIDRIMLRNKAMDGLTLLGNGYSSMFIDNPLLQAFYDLGLFGGILFASVALIIPIVRAFNLFRVGWGNSPASQFATYVYLFSLPNLLLHGRPYDFTLWIPIVLFYGLCFRSQSLAHETRYSNLHH